MRGSGSGSVRSGRGRSEAAGTRAEGGENGLFFDSGFHWHVFDDSFTGSRARVYIHVLDT